MTVEGKRGSMGREGGSRDQFPVGMRVLAVDDDPTCLKLLETLLLRCQYHVTTTNQAITALKMLRENKDRFDLVISDVHMPDMDGFKLLELVGLEMDLPVIMLSANDETKAVMKGITHGAVDYLLKPVRIEELRNIWQHVLRRRKLDRKDRHKFDNGEDCEKSQHADSQGGQVAVSHGSPDHNGKLNRKRKDQNEDDEDDCEDEDPSAQKKPRVVWSVGLHCKFVAAVNQLGIDKAVPKRILDLMNVENLTRENVASHLQKYRLYLKRLSAMASQQANMVAALGGRDLSNLPMCSMDGFGNFHELLASSQPPAISSSQQNGVVNIMGPTGFGLQGLARSAIVQFNHPHDDTRNPINDIRKLQHVNLMGNQHDNLLQGMPTSLELEKFQHKRIQETSNPLLLQAQKQHMRSRGLVNHSSLRTPSMSSDPFEMSAVPLNSYTAKNFPMAASSQDELAPGNMGTYANPMVSQIDIDPLNMTSNSMIAAPPHDLVVGREAQCQASSLGDTMLMRTGVGEDTRFLNFRSIDNSRQKWGESKQNCNHEPNLIFSTSMNSPLFSHPIVDPITENQRLNNGLCSNNIDRNMIGHMNFSASLLTQSHMIDKLTSDAQLKDDYNLETSKLQGGLNSYGSSIGDLVNAMIKQEHGDFAFVDDDIGCDAFPLGTCM